MPGTSQSRHSSSPTATRDEKLRQHLGLVFHVAHQVAGGRPGQVDVEDLLGAGTLGLIEALEHFDESRGFAFSTYAAARIRGAMLDELRRVDRVPRSVRRKARQIDGAAARLARALGRAPAEPELAEGLGIDLATLWRWQSEREAASVVPLDRVMASPEPGRLPHDAFETPGSEIIEDEISGRQESSILRDALLALPQQERTVLSLYYFEELKLADIAQVLRVSESRVSQIRTRAIERLRPRLRRLRA